MNITVIGLGPGAGLDLTGRAKLALEQADLLVGYGPYIELIRGDYSHKEVLITPMRREVERCQAAVDAALEGRTVAVVCSGDSGVYGMAGLVHELCEHHPEIAIQVIPGITAALGGAAVLGAPLTHDFAVISLSDLMTPWEKIEMRLAGAAMADFVVCLYNPRSRARADYLDRACAILLQHKDPDTVCAYVQNIGRTGEVATITTLANLVGCEAVDMFTTVYIGNSQTKVIHGKMVTPRGYLQRED